MRKFMAVFFAVLFISGATATTVKEENVEVDLSTSKVKIDIEIRELTSSKFTYLTSFPVSDLKARSGGSSLGCTVEQLRIGSEIKCDPSRKNNFSISLNFTGSGLTESRQNYRIFRYSQSIFRPTRNHSLRVILPEGAGILDDANVSTPVISPGGAETGSDGRRIYVEWNTDPRLGETLDFQVIYEDFSPADFNYIEIGLLMITGLVVLFSAYMIYLRLSRENIENVYEELDDDETRVIELIRENEGEMLQKDLVGELDYSKAKVSGLVSGLVEEEILVKEKKGRSNSLSISRSYRG